MESFQRMDGSGRQAEGVEVRRPRLKDVAERAGVSVGTVSRVINDHPNITPELLQRVESAIAELGYRPNVLARSFRQQRSRTFGLVVPDIAAPFFAELAKRIEAAASLAGYTLLLADADYSFELECHHVTKLADRRVDGLILAPTSTSNPVPKHDRSRVVVVDRELPGMDFIGSDHKAGAVSALDHLTTIGHEVIACIAGPQELPPLRLRLEGYLDFAGPHLDRLGLDASAYVRTGPWSYQFGYEAATSLLTELRPRPTAIFASSDQQAIGALRACADIGLDVPGDISVIGYDDIPIASLFTPRLTTVRQPLERTAELAVERLLMRLETPDRRRRRMLLPTELVLRESTAAPRRAADRRGGNVRGDVKRSASPTRRRSSP